MTNAELTAAGYRVISRKYKSVARIDRADWQQVLAKHHAPWDPEGQGMEWVRNIGAGNAEDYYRRCLSKDEIIVADIKCIPNSGHAVTGYRGK